MDSVAHAQKNSMRSFFISTAVILACFIGSPFVHAQDIPDREIIAKSEVISIVSAREELTALTEAERKIQTIRVRVLEGEEKGKIFEFENDFTQLKEGDVFYLKRLIENNGTERFSVSDPYRLPVLLGLFILFVALVFVYGGKQGVRELLALIGSMLLIFYVLLPGAVQGVPILWLTLGVASLIVILGSYITHGFSRMTTSAVLGMIATVLFSGALAFIATSLAKLSGYSSDESTALFFQYEGTIDLVGVLLSGMVIGLLGVLYDSAIGQAAAVAELYCASEKPTKRIVYLRALRIGREHIGALINTLALAYVGSSLPLFILFATAQAPLLYIINAEVFATEIIRILVGSIGLILSVPLTTFIAVHLLDGQKVCVDHEHGHSHGHSHG
jgi:uncharacterized membrane protein